MFVSWQSENVVQTKRRRFVVFYAKSNLLNNAGVIVEEAQFQAVIDLFVTFFPQKDPLTVDENFKVKINPHLQETHSKKCRFVSILSLTLGILLQSVYGLAIFKCYTGSKKLTHY